MLGNVLTAIVTPFRDDGAVDFDAFQTPGAPPRRRTAPTESSSPARPARARRSTDAERLDLFRAAVEAVGDEATVVAGTGTYSTAHSVASDRAGARARRRRVPRRHAVLQQAAAARHRRALRGDRRASDRPIVVYNIPEPRRRATSSPRRSAGSPRSRPCAPSSRRTTTSTQARHIVATGLDLYAGDDILIQPFLELGGVGGICVHTHIVGPQVAEQVRRRSAATSSVRARSTTELAPRLRAAAGGDKPDPDQGRAAAARARGRRPPPAARRPDGRRAGRRCGAASSGSAFSSRV